MGKPRRIRKAMREQGALLQQEEPLKTKGVHSLVIRVRDMLLPPVASPDELIQELSLKSPTLESTVINPEVVDAVANGRENTIQLVGAAIDKNGPGPTMVAVKVGISRWSETILKQNDRSPERR